MFTNGDVLCVEDPEDKIDQLIDLTHFSKPLIDLDAEKFEFYVRSADKDYSFIVLFTIRKEHGCKPCSNLYEHMTTLAECFRSYEEYYETLFFGVVDYEVEAEIFESMSIKYAPMLVYFPPYGELVSEDFLDLEGGGLNIHEWVEERIENKEPHPFIALISFLPPSWQLQIKKISTDSIATFSVVFSIVMMGGAQFNQMREDDVLHYAGSEYELISKDRTEQFLIESYIVMVLSHGAMLRVLIAVCVASMIMIIEGSRRRNRHSGNYILTTLQTASGVVGLCLSFALLSYVYQIKTSIHV